MLHAWVSCRQAPRLEHCSFRSSSVVDSMHWLHSVRDSTLTCTIAIRVQWHTGSHQWIAGCAILCICHHTGCAITSLMMVGIASRLWSRSPKHSSRGLRSTLCHSLSGLLLIIVDGMECSWKGLRCGRGGRGTHCAQPASAMLCARWRAQTVSAGSSRLPSSVLTSKVCFPSSSLLSLGPACMDALSRTALGFSIAHACLLSSRPEHGRPTWPAGQCPGCPAA